MAIRRCPYCKAIIDESQKYCNNCGTQLLFPEDEFVEEDIKGEKIVDKDFKDSEEELEESLDPSGEEEAQSEEIDLEEVLEGEAAFPGEDEEEEKEDEVEEETAEPAKPAPAKTEPVKLEPVKAEPPIPPPPKAEPVKPAPPKLEPAKAEEPIEEKPRKRTRPQPAIKTPVVEEREVQAIAADEPPDDVEDEAPLDEDIEPDEEDDDKSDPVTREEIVRLIAALEKKQKKLSLTRDEEKLLAPLEEASSLPAWADLSKSNASTEIVEEDAEEKTEAQNCAPGDTMDFEEEVMSRAEKMAPTRPTIGIPEKVAKGKSASLFAKKGVDTAEAEEIEIPLYDREEAEEDVYEAGEAQDEAEEPQTEVPRTRLGFFGRLTAFIFDLIFIALVWMGTVWGASLMMDVPVRALVRAVPIPLGGFFLILLVGYFFLFFFFLGDTLGGRMASPRD